MSELTTDILIDNILNGMTKNLNDEQLKQLKDVLHIELHDVEVSNKCYDIIKAMEENDTKKIQIFVASQRVRRLSEKTIDQYVGSVLRMRAFIGKNFVDIKTDDINFYLATFSFEKQWKTNTLINNINNLNAFFSFLKRKKLISENPLDNIEPVKEEKVIRTAFNAAELEQLRIACNGDYRNTAILEFLLATGVRVGDLIKLKWEDIDFTHLEFIVRGGKGNKDRLVPFNEKCGFYLLRYLDFRMTNEERTKEEMLSRPLFARRRKDHKTKDYEAMTNGGVEKILKKIGAAALIDDIYPHKFRRTFASDAINRGMPIENLMKILGHEEYDTTLNYAKVKDTRVIQSYRTYCE